MSRGTKYVREYGIDTENCWRVELSVDDNTLTIVKIENGREQKRVSFKLTFTQPEIETLISALIDLVIGMRGHGDDIGKLVEMREFFLGNLTYAKVRRG